MTNTCTTSHDYSDKDFIGSTAQNAGSIGRSLLFKAFCLYYAMMNPNIPLPLKLSVMASLAYLVCPVDAIPDFIPVLGYADDGGVLAAVFNTVRCFIDDDVEKKASRKVQELLD